jgi:hypothetical protein
MAQKIALSKIKKNAQNPRTIKDESYSKLVQSIKDFPEMLELRPLIVDSDMVVLGGNMRLTALKELGYKEAPVLIADQLTEEQKREFIIKDNLSYGEWDWHALGELYQLPELEAWGLDAPELLPALDDFSDKNKELNAASFEDQTYSIQLKFTEDQYNFVKEKIAEIEQTAEQVLYEALVSL